MNCIGKLTVEYISQMNYKKVKDYMDVLVEKFPEYDTPERKIILEKLFKKGFDNLIQLLSEDFNVVVGRDYWFFEYLKTKDKVFRNKQIKQRKHAKGKYVHKGVRVRQQCISNTEHNTDRCE